MSNHLLVQLQRQHILLSYFKTLSVGPVWGSNPQPPAQQTGAPPTELTRRRFYRGMKSKVGEEIHIRLVMFIFITFLMLFIYSFLFFSLSGEFFR